MEMKRFLRRVSSAVQERKGVQKILLSFLLSAVLWTPRIQVGFRFGGYGEVKLSKLIYSAGLVDAFRTASEFRSVSCLRQRPETRIRFWYKWSV